MTHPGLQHKRTPAFTKRWMYEQSIEDYTWSRRKDRKKGLRVCVWPLTWISSPFGLYCFQEAGQVWVVPQSPDRPTCSPHTPFSP
ncbi:hypothetical protein AMELA_G00159050 [Ameiurus melas]|uniref:Uncharacterized protein n=1 Tax=Ameiurus melas TaxID=219545 RepID=A0A7J6AEE0_AMEME|nr:hypothetical protein AMELA_G00159050 [Ameiurus melas]